MKEDKLKQKEKKIREIYSFVLYIYPYRYIFLLQHIIFIPCSYTSQRASMELHWKERDMAEREREIIVLYIYTLSVGVILLYTILISFIPERIYYRKSMNRDST